MSKTPKTAPAPSAGAAPARELCPHGIAVGAKGAAACPFCNMPANNITGRRVLLNWIVMVAILLAIIAAGFLLK